VFLLEDGTVRTVGYNSYGQCATGNTTINQLSLYNPVNYNSLIQDIFSLGQAKILLNGYSTTPQNALFNSIVLNAPIKNIFIADAVLTGTYIKYAVSTDGGVSYKAYKDSAWTTITDFSLGNTSTEVNAITSLQWGEEVVQSILIKAYIGTTDLNVTPIIESIAIQTEDVYTPEASILTGSIQINTSGWLSVAGCTITQTTPVDTSVVYAFSNDSKVTWKVYSGGWVTVSDITTQGMTKAQVEALTEAEWAEILGDTLDVYTYLTTNSIITTPSVDQITFSVTYIDPLLESNTIEVPAPPIGFKNVLIEEVYTLKVTDGVAFDSDLVDYDFFTTADRIKIKPLNIGTLIGGSTSNIYAFEVINGYIEKDLEILLKASKNNILADEGISFGLLPDSVYPEGKTKVEISLVGGESFAPSYPLVFTLNREQKKIIYIRITSSSTTSGDATFQINLTGREV
jgi:hypothetical protein